MERRSQFNLGYLLFALVAMLALQQWWQRAQTVEVVPYSEFEKLLAEHRIDEVVISDQRITGKLKSAEGGKTVAVANLVPPDLAERLSKYDVKYTRVYESTFVRDLLSWNLQDSSRARGRRRGEGAVFLDLGLRVRRDVRRRGRRESPRSVRAGAAEGAGDHLHRRARRARPGARRLRIRRARREGADPEPAAGRNGRLRP